MTPDSTTTPDDTRHPRVWSVDGEHGLHIVGTTRDGVQYPIATFHNALDALTAVVCRERSTGLREEAEQQQRDGTTRTTKLEDFPFAAREILGGQAHPYYGLDLWELTRDWGLVAMNAVNIQRERVEFLERELGYANEDRRRVLAVRSLLRVAEKRKNVETQAVAGALDNPEWTIKHHEPWYVTEQREQLSIDSTPPCMTDAEVIRRDASL